MNFLMLTRSALPHALMTCSANTVGRSLFHLKKSSFGKCLLNSNRTAFSASSSVLKILELTRHVAIMVAFNMVKPFVRFATYFSIRLG